jgi:hypothetical protein
MQRKIATQDSRMTRIIGRSIRVFGLLGLIAIGNLPSASFAGCFCQCSDGAFKPVCSGPYDIAPICPARACSTAIRQKPMRIGEGGKAQCAPFQECDTYGHCEWKSSCK